MTYAQRFGNVEQIWDADYIHISRMERAYKNATNSPDPSTQNGAVLFNHMNERIADSCNTFPRDVELTPERLNDRDTKLQYIEHAERNAIYEAASSCDQGALDGILYCPWLACADCARAIIQSGIKECWSHFLKVHQERELWHGTIDHAHTMLNEAGVKHYIIMDPLPEAPMIRFAGKMVQP